MPTLEITRAGLNAEHAGATLDYVLSIMAWPVECDLRRQFQRTCAAWRRKEASAAVPGLPVDPDLCDELLAAWPPDLITKELRPQLDRGMRVGYFYATACGRASWDRPGLPLSIKSIRGDMTDKAHRAAHSAQNVGDKLLERDLHDFRSVATLWAAGHISFAEGLDIFRPDRIADFLALSEWVRKTATTAKVQSRREPLLSPDADVWRPPSWLRLPQQVRGFAPPNTGRLPYDSVG